MGGLPASRTCDDWSVNRPKRAALIRLVVAVVALALAAWTVVTALSPNQTKEQYVAALLLTPVALWLVLAWMNYLRFRRLLVAVSLWSVAYYGTLLLPNVPQRVATGVLLVAFLVGLIWPESWGMRGRGTKATDALIGRARQYISTPELDAAAGRQLAAALDYGKLPVRRGEWAAAAMLYRHAILARERDPSLAAAFSEPFHVAGWAYWVEARQLPLVFRVNWVDAWDERQALRGYIDDVHALIPDPTVRASPATLERTRRVITELEGLPLRNRSAIDVRGALVSKLTAEVAIAAGAATAQTAADLRAATAFVQDLFATLDRVATSAAESRTGGHRIPVPE